MSVRGNRALRRLREFGKLSRVQAAEPGETTGRTDQIRDVPAAPEQAAIRHAPGRAEGTR